MMVAAIDFIEAHWAPLTLGAVAVCLMIGDAPIGALICAFGSGRLFRENH